MIIALNSTMYSIVIPLMISSVTMLDMVLPVAITNDNNNISAILQLIIIITKII